jgi:hypothetical protein
MKNLSGWAIALIIIGVLLLAGGVFYFLRPKEVEAPNVAEVPEAPPVKKYPKGTGVPIPDAPVDGRSPAMQSQRLRRV